MAHRQKSGSQSKRKKHSASLIFETLRYEILTLKISPGSMLDEISLSEKFSVSRTPIREALLMLSHRKLIQSDHYRSVQVTPIEFTKLQKFIDALSLFQRATGRDAAANRNEEDLDLIKSKAAHCKEAVKSSNFLDASKEDREFHFAIGVAGRNPYYLDTYDALLDECQRLMNLLFLHENSLLEKIFVATDHERMIQSVTDGDFEKIDRLSYDHVEKLRDALQQFLRMNKGGKIEFLEHNT